MNKPPFSILLSGGRGQVGTEVLRGAEEMGLTVHAFGHGELDITNPADVAACLARLSPNLVINAAAYTAVDKAEEEPAIAFAVNRDGAANLAESCASHNIPLLHISTDYVFDGSKNTAYSEADPASPLGVYGQSKWEGEKAVRLRLEQHIILRVAWVFGASGHNFVKTMLRLAQSHDALRVVSDQHGGPTPARAIAATLLTLVERYRENGHLEWGTYHYCGSPATTWCDFAKEIFTQATAKGLLAKPVTVQPITTAEYPTAAQRPKNSVLSGEKLNRLYNIAAPGWQEGLAQVLSELKE